MTHVYHRLKVIGLSLSLWVMVGTPATGTENAGKPFIASILEDYPFEVEPAKDSAKTLMRQMLPGGGYRSEEFLIPTDLGLMKVSPRDYWSVELWDLPAVKVRKRYGYFKPPIIGGYFFDCHTVGAQHWMAMACADELQLIDIKEGKPLPLNNVKSRGFVPLAAHGQYLVTRNFENKLTVQPTISAAPASHIVEDFTGEIKALSASEDFIAGAMDDHSIRVWNRNTGKQIYHFTDSTENATDLQIIDKQLIASVGTYTSKAKTMRIYDLQTGKIERNLPLLPPGNEEATLRFKDQKLITMHSESVAHIKIWDWPQMSQTHELKLDIFDFTYRQSRLYTQRNEPQIEVYSAITQQKLMTWDHFKNNIIALDSDRDSVVAADSQGNVYRLDPLTGNVIETLETELTNISSLQVEGNQVRLSSWEHGTQIWDFHSKKRTFLNPRKDENITLAVLSQGALITATAVQKIELWNVPQGKRIQTLSRLPNVVSQAHLSDNDLLLAYKSGAVDTYAFSPDSAALTFSSREKPFESEVTALQQTENIQLFGSGNGDVYIKVGEHQDRLKLQGSISNIQILKSDPLEAIVVITYTGSTIVPNTEANAPYPGYASKISVTANRLYQNPQDGSFQLNPIGPLKNSALAVQDGKVWVAGDGHPVELGKPVDPVDNIFLSYQTDFKLHNTQLLSVTSFADPSSPSFTQTHYRLRELDLHTGKLKDIPTPLHTGEARALYYRDHVVVVDDGAFFHRFDLQKGKKISSTPFPKKTDVQVEDPFVFFHQESGRIAVHDLKTGQRISQFTGHSHPVHDLKRAQDFAVSRDRNPRDGSQTACIWHLKTGKTFYCLKAPDNNYLKIEVNPHGINIEEESGQHHVFATQTRRLSHIAPDAAIPEVSINNPWNFSSTTFNGHYWASLAIDEQGTYGILPVRDLKTGDLKVIVPSQYFSGNNTRLSLLNDILGFRFFTYPDNVKTVQFWRISDAQPLLKIAGDIDFTNDHQAVISSSEPQAVTLVSFLAHPNKTPYTLQRYSGVFLKADQGILWIYQEKEKQLLGVDMQKQSIVYRLEGIQNYPELIQQAAGKLWISDAQGTLHSINLKQRNAQERWYFFPTAFLKAGPQQDLFAQGNIAEYMHWVKDGQVETLDSLAHHTP